jgi:hypothetical protein
MSRCREAQEAVNLSADTATMQPGCAADTSPKANGNKTRLLTLDDLDKRTRAAQRTFDLTDKLLAERGGAESTGELRKAITRGVALLTAMIEDAGARWLSGEPIDPAIIPTLINARRRDAELIHIDPEPRDVTPDLQTYLRSKVEADDSASEQVGAA